MFFCANCFGEPELKKRINGLASKESRSNCGVHLVQKAVGLEALLELFDEAFRNNYDKGYLGTTENFTLTSAITKLMAPESSDFAENFAKALIDSERKKISANETAFYDLGIIYSRSDTISFWFSYLWMKFTESILHEQRFFNSNAQSLLDEIFRSVEKQKSAARQSPIYLIQPDDKYGKIKRARLDEDGLKRKIRENPSRELSAPPQELSTSGRLNASGIPVFYGSYDDETCAAEIRAPVGSIIYCGEFHITAPICVLDTTLFNDSQKDLSIFAPYQNMRKDQWLFMRRFMEEISRPVIPKQEHLEYVPTQVVAEFLRSHFEVRVKGLPKKLDGIIYSSSQKPGQKNIALFLGDSKSASRDKTLYTGAEIPKLRLINHGRLRVRGASFDLEPAI